MQKKKFSYRVRSFSLRNDVQAGNKMILLRLAAISSLHVLPAFALSSDHVAVIIQRTARIAVARCATFWTFRESVSLRHALVAVAAHYQSLASAFAGVEVAAEIIHRSQNVACALLATVGVVRRHVPESFFANVATSALDMGFAVTRASLSLNFRVSNRITNSIIIRSNRVTVARFAGVRTLNVFVRVPIEERHALFAVLALSVVLTVVAITSADTTRVFINRMVEVTAHCMIVAVAL